MDKSIITKFLIIFFCLSLLGVAEKGFSAHYKTDRPWEIDSVLVAWLIKHYVDKDAVFSSVPRGEHIKKEFSINTPYSPLRRSARCSAFDAGVRIYKVKSQCVEKIRPLIRLLEITSWRKHEYPEALKFEQGLMPLIPLDPGIENLEKAFLYIDSYCGSDEPSMNFLDPVSFIALIDKCWKIVIIQNNLVTIIKTQQEPRTFDHEYSSKKTVYIGSDKSVRLIENGKEHLLLSPKQHAYTQPAFSADGKSIYLVKLINGNSINTDIICLHLESNTLTTVVKQRSTQLDPYISAKGKLYYSNVSCVDGRGKIIQEIWYKNITANNAKQLTLLNSLSHQPVVNKKNNHLFFSSNRKGYYHIWMMSLDGGKYKQLTTGAVADSFPAVQSDGTVFFIRALHGRNFLMKVDENGMVQEVKLPEQYTKIRELKVN